VPTVMQWTIHLLGKIEAQRLYSAPYELRYRNEYVLPFIAREYREVYGEAVDLVHPALTPPRTGTAGIGIDALVERLTVQGATSDDPVAARRMQIAWEDNDLDVMHREAHREALIKARAFGAVSRSADNARAIVGIESPEQMAVHRQSAPPYDVDASLKVQTDEWTGQRRGLLQLPGRDIPLVEALVAYYDPEGSGAHSRWVIAPEGERPSRMLGVPVVEFACRSRLLTEPISDIEPIVTEVDVVDLIEGLMVFAGHFGAVPIRAISGVPVMRDPKDPTGNTPLMGPDGKPIMGFVPRADHTWLSTDPQTKFQQLTPAGLEAFVQWANHASSRVRARTSIASTYYSIDLKSHMSAELLKTDEAPMVRRVNAMGRDGSFGQSWRRLFRLMMEIEDPGSRARVKSRWADPETRVEAQATDSAQKLTSAGYGRGVVGETVLGWDPETVTRAVAEGNSDRRLADPATPPTDI